MRIEVQFWSYFKELTGRNEIILDLPEGSSLGALLEKVFTEFPKLRQMERSMLIAVGVEYQDSNWLLREGDKVSLFPPVQGG
jgi:sulfur-carrier protein